MPDRQPVTGIGGFFFSAQNPASLGRWYDEHLGVAPPPESYGSSSWWQQAGPKVVAPMSADEPHVAGAGWTLNLRVAGLDAMSRSCGTPPSA